MSERNYAHNSLVPMPGDAVVLTGEFSIAKPGALGILDGTVGVQEDEYSITFNCEGSAFRSSYVSCSGGPGTIGTPTTELIHTGERITFQFWRWKDRPRAQGGEPYVLTVPLWVWRGESADVDPGTEQAIIQSLLAKRNPSPTESENEDAPEESPAPR